MNTFFTRSRSLGMLLAALGLCATTVQAQGRDPVAGKARASLCATCHGPLGISQAPDAPNLAGQPAIYVAQQLRNYRSGKRPHEVMSVMAKPLTDDDIDNLAAWYASIKFTVSEK